MKVKIEIFRNMIAEIMAELRLRMHRGMGYIYETKSAVLMGVSVGILFDISAFTIGIITIGCLIGFYILGYIDVKYLRWMQSEQKLSTSKYNPHLNKISDIADDVKKKGGKC